MRRRVVIAPIALLAGVLLAWRLRRARAARTSLGPQPATPRVSAAPAPAAPLAAPTPPPDSHFVSVPWTLVAAPADRAELTIRYAGHDQLELDRVDAQETPTQVFVTALMRPCGAASSSAGEPQERETTVRLSGPLGARELVHAPEDLSAPSGGEPSASPLYP